MVKKTIEQQFGAAMRYAEHLHGRGFQASLIRRLGLGSSNLSEIIHKDKGASEATRRLLHSAVAECVPDLSYVSYDCFLGLGQLILDGKPDDQALKMAQRASRVVVSELGSLHTGIAPIMGIGGISEPAPSIRGATEMLTRVPLISFVQAGDWSGVVDNFQPGDAEEWIPFPGHIGPHAFALRVNGPSMEPRFVEGDIIFVDPDREVESGDFIIAKNGADEATFKKFYRDGDRCFLVPLNEDWGKPMEMTGRDWKIVGRVMGKLDLF